MGSADPGPRCHNQEVMTARARGNEAEGALVVKAGFTGLALAC